MSGSFCPGVRRASASARPVPRAVASPAGAAAPPARPGELAVGGPPVAWGGGPAPAPPPTLSIGASAAGI
eukprot:2941529-Lingulodinium_polyedra.AAC.1